MTSTTPASADQLRTIIETERARFNVPGCAVLVVQDGTVVLSEGFGRRNLGDDLPVTTQTLFPIGSSTKTFTAATCGTLVDEGRLEWDRPVREYLPDFRMLSTAATEQLTLRDMLSHRSGLPRHDLLWYADDGTLTRDDLVHALRYLEPSKGLREVFQYNNLLYATAGQLAGRLHGGSFEDAVRDRILTPLGMKRTNFSVADAQADADVSRPYVVTPGSTEAKEVPFASLDLAGAAGNINSCVEEMTAWLLTLLGQGERPLLSEATRTALRTPVIPSGLSGPLSIGKSVGYGLALSIDDYRGHRVTHHGGNIDGFSSQVSFIAEAGVGVVVLTNRNATALRDALPFLLYDVLLGLEPQPHGERLHEAFEALSNGAEQAKANQKANAKDLPAVRPLADYAGSYEHKAYGRLTVRLDGAALAADYRALKGSLEHRHLEVFDLVATVAGSEQRIPLQFTSNFDAEIDAVRVPLEAAVAPIRFERVPPTEHLTDELLDRLSGTFALGPIEVEVRRQGERGLVLSIAGGAPQPLVPVHDTVFTLSGQRLEFTADGRILSPMGELVRTA